MDFRRKFEFGLAWRSALLVLSIGIFTQSLTMPDLRAGRIIAAIITFVALASLWDYIRRTNFLVSRFVESVRM